mgnify:CR=1 FL=1
MKSELDRAFMNLNCRTYPKEVERVFFRAGESGFEVLVAKLQQAQMPELQTINALRLLMALRLVGGADRSFEQILRATEDPRIRVRSAATQLAIGYTRFSEQLPYAAIPLAKREIVKPAIERAVTLGIRPKDTLRYAQDFLSNEV